jgi:hypothetical protein
MVAIVFTLQHRKMACDIIQCHPNILQYLPLFRQQLQLMRLSKVVLYSTVQLNTTWCQPGLSRGFESAGIGSLCSIVFSGVGKKEKMENCDTLPMAPPAEEGYGKKSKHGVCKQVDTIPKC